MRFDIERKNINIFKIGNIYCFKVYFSDKEIFKELSTYYNKERYRFECNSVSERKKIIKYLWNAGYDTTIVEDINEYTVKINLKMKYATILKNSIEQTEIGNDRIFLMKDKLSVKQAIEQGAEKYTDKIEDTRLIL
jgi:hypothetical protein